MLKIEFSLIFIGILNIKCAVLPFSSKVAAIPDNATANCSFPAILLLAITTFIKNVLQVPGGASKKNNFSSLLLTLQYIIIYYYTS